MENPKILALELGCEVDSLPKAYLGLPLGANHNPQRVWDGVEERFKKRLALWKRHYISIGGRLTLIRNTLSNMSIYLMSLIRLPKGVKKRLERIQRDFLWGDRKVHLINWKTVCLSKEREAWESEASSTLIELSLESGVGDLPPMKMLFFFFF